MLPASANAREISKIGNPGFPSLDESGLVCPHKSRTMLPCLLLSEKNRELRDHIVSNKSMYLSDTRDVKSNHVGFVPDGENDARTKTWLELYRTPERQDYGYRVTVSLNFRGAGKVLRDLEIEPIKTCWDNPVLAGVADTIKNPKRVRLVFTLSMVRLKAPNQRASRRRNVFPCLNSTIVSRLPLQNRETSELVGVGFRQQCQLPRKMVQRKPNTIDALCQKDSKSAWGRRFPVANYITRLLVMFLQGTDKPIALKEKIDLLIERINVFLCSFKKQFKILYVEH